MASLIHDKSNDTRMIQFTYPPKKTRRTIRLGKMSARDANAFKSKIESVVSAKNAGTSLEDSVAVWVSKLNDNMASILAKWGLIEPRIKATGDNQESGSSLLDFVDNYIKTRTDVKPRTHTNHIQSRGFVEKYFKDARIESVTNLDAKTFRNKMLNDGHSENYVRTQCKNIKMFFGAAVDARLIAKNPFDKIPTKILSVPERMKFIPSVDIELVISKTTDIEWRLVISLSRWGGLRIPSEINKLRWDHINWETNRITIPQPKLARHEGKEYRVIPIFPELMPVLKEAFGKRPPGSVYMTDRLRNDSGNLRTTFNRMVTRAGLIPWTRPFANMRSTRATELAKTHPLKIVAEWMGHDAQVSLDHYQQVRDEDWEAAISTPTPIPSKALQKAQQTDTEQPRKTPTVEIDSSVLRDDSVLISALREQEYPRAGSNCRPVV